MTGVAEQLCADRKAVESLGYHVDADGLIYERPPASYRSPIVVQEDADLLMVYDNALMRMEGNPG